MLVIGTGDNPLTIAVVGDVGGVFADVGHCAGANDLLNMIAGDEVIDSLCWSSCREGSGQGSEDSDGGEDSRLHFDV